MVNLLPDSSISTDLEFTWLMYCVFQASIADFNLFITLRIVIGAVLSAASSAASFAAVCVNHQRTDKIHTS